MAMDAPVTDKYLLEWDESDVHAWLSSLGLPQYERQIRENSIRGDSLCAIDVDSLKFLGVQSIGQRLSILKAVYDLKLAQDIPIGEDDYVPPSQATASVSINDVFADVKAQDERLRTLEGETRKVHDQMKSLLEDLAKFRSSITPASSQEKPATKELTYAQSDVEAIGRAALGNIVNLPPRSHTPQSQISSNSMTPPSNASGESPPAPETPEIYKASRDDPTWKVLPAALRKHRIHLDDWPNYAMFISYGPRENRTKRKLGVNDKPFQLFSKLKDAKMNPAFVLTDMKGQRTPGGTPSPSHTP